MRKANRFAPIRIFTLLLGAGAMCIDIQPAKARDLFGDEVPKVCHRDSIPVGKTKEKKFPHLAKISLRVAKQTALGTVPGKVLKSNLENENGILVYELEIASGDGLATEVTVDAGSGAILGISTEEPVHSEKEYHEHKENEFERERDRPGKNRHQTGKNEK